MLAHIASAPSSGANGNKFPQHLPLSGANKASARRDGRGSSRERKLLKNHHHVLRIVWRWDASRRNAEVPMDLHRNRILKALDPETLQRLGPSLEHVPMRIRDHVYHSDEPIAYAYFPLDGVFSMIGKLDSGESVEVATVGNEGFVGLPLFLGGTHTPGSCFCQVPGSTMRLPAADFRELVRTPSSFSALLLRYTQALFVQVSQTAACNRAHSIEERCARWLLLTHDRMGRDDFELTQEFLGQMLGVRRASVNLIAGMFQKAGIIDYSRGIVRVLDRRALEASSCGCYAIVRDEYDRLLNMPRG